MFLKKKKIIVTHSARFHADDLFATAMLFEYLGGNAEVIRSVDPEIISKADYVLDIGSVYDPEKNRFDHHQGGAGMRANGVTFAAAGLVWKHFGEKIAGNKEAADKVDERLVAQIDAIDTGDAEIKPLIADVYPYFLNDMAKTFGNTWLETDRDFTEGFMFLLPFARAIIKREVLHANAKIEAEKVVSKAYDEAQDKRIIIINANYPPIDSLQDKPEPLFVICPDSRTKGNWAVLTVRKNKKEYGNRKDLPKEWAGLSDKKLADISGVPDATFCHLKLFLAVAKSKEGALALAKKALEN